jgi:hypothetical protein
MLKKIIPADMSVARLNFSHGDFEAHWEIINRLRKASESTGRRVAVMADLPGPKIRIGRVSPEPVELKRGGRDRPDHEGSQRKRGTGEGRTKMALFTWQLREGEEMRERNCFSSSSVAVAVILGLTLPALIGGCAAGSRARLERSQQVYQDFMAGNVLPGHRYYTTGPQSAPDAILGVSDKYTLKSERWTEREFSPQVLKELVGRMNTDFKSPVAGLLGAYVQGPEGQRIGVWYSGVGITTVELLSETEVRIDPPLTAAINQLKDRE